ncbi:hypothetical protein ACFE04_028391 [Oxalis oulophora]
MPKRKRNSIVRDNIDRISKLPDEILCRILSCLQTKDAVKTSALSKRWEQVWTSIPIVEFSDNLQSINNFDAEFSMFKDYVHNVLFQHGGSAIEKCRLFCNSVNSLAHLYGWICAIVFCSVQELTIRIFGVGFNDMPWSVFTCKTLVFLRIEGRFVLHLPRSFSLPNLKTLILNSVIFVDDASAERFFLGCPFLEKLNIKRCHCDGVQTLNISIPSLKKLSIAFYLSYFDRDDRVKTKINTPNLEYLTIGDEISTDYMFNPLPSLINARIYKKCVYGVLEGIQNVKLLSLSGDIMASLHNILQDHDLPKFQQLSQLELGVGSGKIDWSLLLNFLESAPNLKALAFPEGLVVRSKSRTFRRFYWVPSDNVPECLLFQLKTVKIQNFVGVPSEVCLVKYLLEYSKVLEKMTIHCLDFKARKLVKNLRAAQNEVVNALKTSEACEVEFEIVNEDQDSVF